MAGQMASHHAFKISQNTVAMGGLHIGIEAELLLQALTFEEDCDIPRI
jgi:hypothetical protein